MLYYLQRYLATCLFSGCISGPKVWRRFPGGPSQPPCCPTPARGLTKARGNHLHGSGLGEWNVSPLTHQLVNDGICIKWKSAERILSENNWKPRRGVHVLQMAGLLFFWDSSRSWKRCQSCGRWWAIKHFDHGFKWVWHNYLRQHPNFTTLIKFCFILPSKEKVAFQLFCLLAKGSLQTKTWLNVRQIS